MVIKDDLSPLIIEEPLQEIDRSCADRRRAEITKASVEADQGSSRGMSSVGPYANTT